MLIDKDKARVFHNSHRKCMNKLERNIATTISNSFLRLYYFKSKQTIQVHRLAYILLLLLSTIFYHRGAKVESQETIDEISDGISKAKSAKALEMIRDWSLELGRDISSGTEEVTCIRSLRNQYSPNDNDQRNHRYKTSIESIDWTTQHKNIVKTISSTMTWHQDAVKAIGGAAEEYSMAHIFNKSATIDYYDVHKIENYEGDATETDLISAINESQNNNSSKEHLITTKQLNLNKHVNFGEVAINTDHSAVHTPVHIYPGDPRIMNDIIWSEQLTKIFQNNFVKNPKLTNQFFASQTGFLRLFPAQKWQVKHDDPDLYDARMRPWYVAGASSRKDVVILVDSSGSMTGSRRDIARGVVLEILDTLTDNDRFVVLKFSDTVQQVGVPVCSEMSPKKTNPSKDSFDAANLSLPPQNELSIQANASSTNPKKQHQLKISDNETIEIDFDINNFYLLPANKRNIRYVKTNFNIPTSGIANFKPALATAMKVLNNYRSTDYTCNQAVMLITDGSPSDFSEIFNFYNWPNVGRMFTYLIGREAGDITNTKMMACHNRGYYTHVINLAEVREAVQQYIPVIARPLVLDGRHPITWTPAYGELTYQILTDWIWESKRREKLRLIQQAALAGSGSNANDSSSSSSTTINDYEVDDYDVFNDERLRTIDLFGYQNDRNCFWQTHRNDLLTTVVRPVYDLRNESIIIENFPLKNTWQTKETMMRTAKLLGVAAADMKINDIIALAPSHKLGPNAYTIMLTNNGFAMHHPDLRSILEPFDVLDPVEKSMLVLKPFFSTIDFSQVEHVVDNDQSNGSSISDGLLLKLREEAISGLTGFRELPTKRAVDCQRRPQIRNQSFYFEPLKLYPFSFITAVPQPYGAHQIKAQVELKALNLPDNVSNYLTKTSDYDLWTLHPNYQYCEGESNNSVTNLLDMLRKIDTNRLDDIQWKASESTNPPVRLHHKLVCDKELVQSLVFDAIATDAYSEKCTIPNENVKSSLIETYNVRFTFVATRSGLTRLRLFNSSDYNLKGELLSFGKFHSRAIDETFYSRTVDYNMLVNASSVLIQVPFNTHAKIKDQLAMIEAEEVRQSSNISTTISSDQIGVVDELPTPLLKRSVDSDYPSTVESNNLESKKSESLFDKLEKLVNRSIHTIATQAIIVNEGPQRAVAGVTGVFYDYASFALRFFKIINRQWMDITSSSQPEVQNQLDSKDPTKPMPSDANKNALYCGSLEDSIDCLLVDNNAYIIISEDLKTIGQNLDSYNGAIMKKLIEQGVYRQINITDYQAVCMRSEEKLTQSSKPPSSASLPSISGGGLLNRDAIFNVVPSIVQNFISGLSTLWTLISTVLIAGSGLPSPGQAFITFMEVNGNNNPIRGSALSMPPSQLPNKTYLRPCEQTLRLYEANNQSNSSRVIIPFQNDCATCKGWIVYEHVPFTNLIVLIIDHSVKPSDWVDRCEKQCPNSTNNQFGSLIETSGDIEPSDSQTCTVFEREQKLYKKKLDKSNCIASHEDEKDIKLCGKASQNEPAPIIIICLLGILSSLWITRSSPIDR